MKTVLILLIMSALIGLVIGLKYRVFVVALVAPVIGVVTAIAARDFDLVTAAAITLGCLTINQIGYLAGAWLRFRRATSSDTLPSDEKSDDRRDKDR
jgi:hypothetical protein